MPEFAIYPSLKGRSVFVSGGGSGIGASIVEHFAAQGSKVGFVDINEPASNAVAKGATAATGLNARTAACVASFATGSTLAGVGVVVTSFSTVFGAAVATAATGAIASAAFFAKLAGALGAAALRASRFVAAGTARFVLFAGAFAPEPLFRLPLFIIVSVS